MGKPVVAFDLAETRFSAQQAALYATPNSEEDNALIYIAVTSDFCTVSIPSRDLRNSISTSVNTRFPVEKVVSLKCVYLLQIIAEGKL